MADDKSKKTVKVVHTGDTPWAPQLARGKYENHRKELGGLEIMGAGLWQLPPGKKSFPMHAHSVTEEALFVVSGRAKVRTTDGEHAIGPGDWVAFPAKGPAHQLVNDGDEPLVYLGLSANPAGVDVVDYPESGKVACSVVTPSGRRRAIFRDAQQVDYFDGDRDA
jgi:uncharacterized cupin superfamily protein